MSRSYDGGNMLSPNIQTSIEECLASFKITGTLMKICALIFWGDFGTKCLRIHRDYTKINYQV